MRIDGVIRVFMFSRPKFHRLQCKFEDPFSAGHLASIPLTYLYICRHWWSAHAHKFASPWVLSFGCCRRKNVYLLNVCVPIVFLLFYCSQLGLCRYVCIDRLYKLSKFQLTRMKNRRVIRVRNFRHSLPTLDLFEPYVTFTDRDETGARRRVWTNDSLGARAQKFLPSLFRVTAPESCWFVLTYYGLVNPLRSCRALSVYLTTRLLGRLSPLSG